MSRVRDITKFLEETRKTNTDLKALRPSTTSTIDSAAVLVMKSASGMSVFSTLDSLPVTSLTIGQQAYVTENSRIYISNGSGWYNVAVVNATPSLSIDPTGAITLATDGLTPAIITLTATDSDNAVAGLTYSVESDGSFAGLGTISQDSSVFTITPLSEDSATTETSTLTFKASDGINFGSGTTTFNLNFISSITGLEYVVVAGGGSTGQTDAYSASSLGGGGAGGYRSSVSGESSGGGASAETSLTVNPGVTYTVTVGAGGATAAGTSYTVGSNSSISGADITTIESIGGGAGGRRFSYVSSTGGSGGGDAAEYGNGAGAGTTGQGYGGGTGNIPNNQGMASGGGGGAGAAGANAANSNGGDGGIGVQTSITGTPTYFAGGGGGGAKSGSMNPGGAGGGGAGWGGSGPGSSGTVNTGGGAGGGANGYSGAYGGGNGGSGIVILRYPDSNSTAASTTGSPAYSNVGGYHIYQFTGSGTITF
jgi:hypothetical protein